MICSGFHMDTFLSTYIYRYMYVHSYTPVLSLYIISHIEPILNIFIIT